MRLPDLRPAANWMLGFSLSFALAAAVLMAVKGWR